jgi:hypothetical protein
MLADRAKSLKGQVKKDQKRQTKIPENRKKIQTFGRHFGQANATAGIHASTQAIAAEAAANRGEGAKRLAAMRHAAGRVPVSIAGVSAARRRTALSDAGTLRALQCAKQMRMRLQNMV